MTSASTGRRGALPRRFLAALALLLLAGCATTSPARDPYADFWRSLRSLRGQAFTGTVVEAPAGDTVFTGRALVMHVREVERSTVRIPFHVGDDRSRTWVVSRTAAGLRLKHDHRHADGAPDSVTQYGGDSRAGGAPGRVEFPADSFTARLIPRATTNVWTLELEPGRQFVYALRREGTDRRYRIAFDLTRPVPAPPPPWGASP